MAVPALPDRASRLITLLATVTRWETTTPLNRAGNGDVLLCKLNLPTSSPRMSFSRRGHRAGKRGFWIVNRIARSGAASS